MKIKAGILIIVFSSIFLLAACSNEKQTDASTDTALTQGQELLESDTKETEIIPEEYKLLGGTGWNITGYKKDNKLIAVQDNQALADMFSSVYLGFGSDGSFTYLDIYVKEGTYARYDYDTANASYLLKTERVLEYDFDKQEFVEKESPDYQSYIMTFLDDSTFEFVEFDPVTGKAKASESVYIFSKIESNSSYVDDHKTQINKETESSAPEYKEQRAEENSYQAILDNYTNKMENEVSVLVDEYESRAAGISDITKLAEICNDEVTKLAEICNEGMTKMAELMYSKGDAYATYENWAQQLIDNYTDIALEIQDAYIESCY